MTQVTAETLVEFAAMVRTRADSTLAAIDDDSFARGLDHLERDAAREPHAGPIKDTMSLIVFRHHAAPTAKGHKTRRAPIARTAHP